MVPVVALAASALAILSDDDDDADVNDVFHRAVLANDPEPLFFALLKGTSERDLAVNVKRIKSSLGRWVSESASLSELEVRLAFFFEAAPLFFHSTTAADPSRNESAWAWTGYLIRNRSGFFKAYDLVIEHAPSDQVRKYFRDAKSKWGGKRNVPEIPTFGGPPIIVWGRSTLESLQSTRGDEFAADVRLALVRSGAEIFIKDSALTGQDLLSWSDDEVLVGRGGTNYRERISLRRLPRASLSRAL